MTVGDYGYSEPQVSTVYYYSGEAEDTARAIGAALGIAELVEDPTTVTGPNNIAVVLR